MTTPHQPTGSRQHRPLPPSATAYGHHALGLLDTAAAAALSAVKAMLAHTSHTPVTKRKATTSMAKTKKTGGVSLAKGPVALIALVLLAYGITAFIMGGHSFAMHPPSGTVNGKSWLGLEVNAWSSLLFVAAGALLLISAPAHWTAKSMSMIVGIALIAAALIALYDKTDVLGIFAANGLTKLAWGAAGGLLVLLSLLPRVGRKTAAPPRPQRTREPRPSEHEAATRFSRDPAHDAEAGGRRAT